VEAATRSWQRRLLFCFCFCM